MLPILHTCKNNTISLVTNQKRNKFIEKWRTYNILLLIIYSVSLTYPSLHMVEWTLPPLRNYQHSCLTKSSLQANYWTDFERTSSANPLGQCIKTIVAFAVKPKEKIVSVGHMDLFARMSCWERQYEVIKIPPPLPFRRWTVFFSTAPPLATSSPSALSRLRWVSRSTKRRWLCCVMYEKKMMKRKSLIS